EPLANLRIGELFEHPAGHHPNGWAPLVGSGPRDRSPGGREGTRRWLMIGLWAIPGSSRGLSVVARRAGSAPGTRSAGSNAPAGLPGYGPPTGQTTRPRTRPPASRAAAHAPRSATLLPLRRSAR